MKTIITTTDKATIEAGFKNPFGMLISNDPEIRKAVGEFHREYIKQLHAQRRAAK